MALSQKQDPFLKTLAEECEEKVEKPKVKVGNVTPVTSKKPALPDPILSRYNDEGLFGAKPGMVKAKDGKDIAVEELHRAEEQKRLEAEAERRLAMNRENRNRTGAGTRFFNAFDAKKGKSSGEFMIKHFERSYGKSLTETMPTVYSIPTTTGGPLTQNNVQPISAGPLTENNTPTTNAGPIKSNIPAINAGSAIILEPITDLESSRDYLLEDNKSKRDNFGDVAGIVSGLTTFLGSLVATIHVVPALKGIAPVALCALSLIAVTAAAVYATHKLAVKIYKKREMAITSLFDRMINGQGKISFSESRKDIDVLHEDETFRKEIDHLRCNHSMSAGKIHNYITNGIDW